MAILRQEAEETNVHGLEIVKLKREELLPKIKANREQHTSLFQQANAGYQGAVIAAIQKALELAQAGGDLGKYLELPPSPEDHTKDYDRVIAMLEMSVDETLTLPATQFARYALDEWAWSQAFAGTVALYNGRK